MTFQGFRRLAIPVSFCPSEELCKIGLGPAATPATCEQPLPVDIPRDIQPHKGRCSWNCDFGEPPVHAFDDPTLCRGEVGSLLPRHIFVLLGSEPIVFPIIKSRSETGAWISAPSPSARLLLPEPLLPMTSVRSFRYSIIEVACRL
jgi:hypothetical protein